MATVQNYTGLRTFGPICNAPLDGLDYRADRPFIGWHKPALIEHLELWLQSDPPHLELATLALDELRARGKDDRATGLFQARGLAPVGWLMAARKIAASTLPPSPGPKHLGHVYAILRWGYPAMNGTYGVYVGSTTKGVARRFVEHRTGINHGKSLPIYGIEPLYSLFQWANPFPAKDKLKVETTLHLAIKAVVPKVTGDANWTAPESTDPG